MRALSILLIVAGIAVGAATAYIAAGGRSVEPAPEAPPGEFISGPQVGAKLPGTFEPLHINGPDAGEECCMVCKYGNQPVVMVFAKKSGEALDSLAVKLEKSAADAKGEVGACVVVTDTGEATRAELKKLADTRKLKHVILTVIKPEELKRYTLHRDAAVTVVLYSGQQIRANRAFKTGELTETAGDEIAQQAARLYAAQ